MIGVVRVGSITTTATATAETARPWSTTRGSDMLDGMAEPVDLATALATLTGPWSPLTVATLNDYDVRVVRTEGEFTPHSHPETDELFLVLTGELTIRLDAGDVTLTRGQLYVVPRGVQHQPYAPDGAEILLVEPRATVNTGDNPGELTAERRSV